VNAVALQPGEGGNIFATACNDEVVRLFDTRRNVKGGFDQRRKMDPSNVFQALQFSILFVLFLDAVSQSNKRSGALNTIVFSPAEPSVVAVASVREGALICDIRNLKRYLYLVYNILYSIL
jgi:WD40 repeat protein